MSDPVQVIGKYLVDGGRTLATAESCTGGMLGGALTSAPGSSAWYRGGIVVYADDLKIRLAGVDSEILARAGAVSREVARSLACGVRERCGADLGIGITGIAGPGGGTADKPVGTVCIALADDQAERDWQVRFPGDREAVRTATVGFVLDRLLEHLGSPGAGT